MLATSAAFLALLASAQASPPAVDAATLACAAKTVRSTSSAWWGPPPWALDPSDASGLTMTGHDDLPREYPGAPPFPTAAEAAQAARTPVFDDLDDRLAYVQARLPGTPPPMWTHTARLVEECELPPAVELHVELSTQDVVLHDGHPAGATWTLTHSCSSLSGAWASLRIEDASTPATLPPSRRRVRLRLRMGPDEISFNTLSTPGQPTTFDLWRLPAIFDPQSTPLRVDLLDGDTVLATATFDLTHAPRYQPAVAAACLPP